MIDQERHNGLTKDDRNQGRCGADPWDQQDGAARIAIPRMPPRYKYHSDAPGRFLKLTVAGKQRIRRIKPPALTKVSIRTAHRLPARCPNPAFSTLWIAIKTPARIPVPDNRSTFDGNKDDLLLNVSERLCQRGEKV